MPEASTHRLVLEFYGEDGYTASLQHPATGCTPGSGLDNDECWLTDWVLEGALDVLHGKIEIPVEADPDDGCRLEVVPAAQPDHGGEGSE